MKNFLPFLKEGYIIELRSAFGEVEITVRNKSKYTVRRHISILDIEKVEFDLVLYLVGQGVSDLCELESGGD